MFPLQIDNHKLIELCKNGTPDEIRAFLAERGKTTEILNDHFAWQSGPCRASFNLPIVRAVRSGNIEVVKFLLECGADPDKQEDLTQVTARQEATLYHPEILVLFAKFRNGTLGHDAKKKRKKKLKKSTVYSLRNVTFGARFLFRAWRMHTSRKQYMLIQIQESTGTYTFIASKIKTVCMMLTRMPSARLLMQLLMNY